MKLLTASTLIFWLSCYCAGMLFFLIDVHTQVFIMVAGCFLSGCFVKYIPDAIRLYLVWIPLFFAIGFLSMERVFPGQNVSLTNGENYYLGSVEQQLSTDRAWNANLVRLEAAMTKEGRWKKTAEKVVLLTENDGTLLNKHDQLLFRTTWREIELTHNPGEFNSKMYWISKGVRYQGFGASEQLKLIRHVPPGWFDRLLDAMRTHSGNAIDKWVGIENAPVIRAILLGDKSDLDVETKRSFSTAGAMHLLAVSGMHVGLIVLLLLGIFKRLFLHRGRVVAYILILILLWLYAFLTGFSASVVRAVLMFTFLLLAKSMRRDYQPVSALSIAGFFILMWDPVAIFAVGFQLSFLAMLGIFSVYPLLEKAILFRRKWLNTVWQGTAIGLGAQAFTLPVSLFYFHQFPNYFILTNLAIILFASMIVGLGIGLIAVGKISFLSIPVGWLLAVCCSILVGFIGMVELIPGALAVGFSPQWEWVVTTYVFAFCGLYWADRKKWLRLVACLLPVVVWIQTDRLHNLSKQEWVIFNSNYPTLLFNSGQQQVCIYGGHEKGLKQARKLVQDYQKIHPGIVTFYPVTEGVFHLNTGNQQFFDVTLKQGWIDIVNSTDTFALITYENTAITEFSQAVKIISMKPSDNPVVHHDLSEGAYRESL
ncbi:ComEC/Rec2 family competence protein [Crocinitomicaceae bacterium CZZ-1]|uniref:ComEC/Rec2 family competence protein n=1 Tax=Taishania pollutisoli TaxID=2766479 RepID=A0A8J6P439_9FLAO|nr:ComEC/Rec2 family competence protein [Taishania pollutisoli]MBC9811134.1 ComEC/Rec2 family competence protein [Taishania pollutisoli]